MNAKYIELFDQYLRPIVHMRRQIHHKRFGLIFGAGISKRFGVPDWTELVAKIARDPKVDGVTILSTLSERNSLPYKTELLFQHFRQKQPGARDPKQFGTPEFENRVICDWHGIFTKYLYHKVPKKFDKSLKRHPYLLKLLPIIEALPITVTYNFDTFLERALESNKLENDQTRGYETVTNPWTQFRRPQAVIYHPHGVCPQSVMEMPRDKLIFSESSYAKQQIGSFSGDMSFLLNHFSKNTCLIIGSSLEDEALKNMLIHSGQSNPGNPHYYVCYLKRGQKIDAKRMRAIKCANFHVYNLITLFLDDTGIAALGDLLNHKIIDDKGIEDLAKEVKQAAKQGFYFTGALGVGKTSAINQLRSLDVHDEWAEKRLPQLAKPWDQLSKKEEQRITNWILSQFEIKNERLRRLPFGIFATDRPPLDPLAFTLPEKRNEKAKALLDKLSNKGSKEIVKGTVFFLCGDPKELSARLLATGRSKYTSTRLEKMEKDLHSIYNAKGVKLIQTRGRSIYEVVKQISEIIHLDTYTPFDFEKRLKQY